VSAAVAGGAVVIFMAVKEEAAPLGTRLKGGEMGGARVDLVLAGPGPRRAGAVAEQVIAAARPTAVVCAGLGGGLAPELRRGDLVLATRVVEHEGDDAFEPHPDLLAAARGIIPEFSRVHEHVVVTAPRVVGTAAEKRALHPRGGVVDMESAAVARVAERHGVPFLALRVISDTAHEDFPIDLNRYVDEQGNVQRMKLAFAALGRPHAVPFLLRMRQSAVDGAVRLASFLERCMVEISRRSPK